MSAADLNSAIALLSPHFIAVALCSARLLPVAFLCPVLGGAVAPTPVKLGLVLSLALSLHLAGGVAPVVPPESAWAFAALATRELIFGATIGLIAALPFDAARIGGRFIDLFRGSSAEASLPVAGTRESATGDGLYQMVLTLVVSGAAFPVVVGSLWRSFGSVQLGAYVPTEAAALQVAALAGTAMATGLAVGAPIAAAVMAIDTALGMASRFAPQMNLQEVGAPLRIIGGGAVLWLGIGILCDRLLAGVLASDGAILALIEVAR
ncbi:MAG: EscT/YscT/HrcT family type III secretion system export apparatus protein [Myxococcaceae bacterium]